MMTLLIAACYAITITLTLLLAMGLVVVGCCVYAACAALIDWTKEGRAL